VNNKSSIYKKIHMLSGLAASQSWQMELNQACWKWQNLMKIFMNRSVAIRILTSQIC